MVTWVRWARAAGRARGVPTPWLPRVRLPRCASTAVVSEQMSDEALELFVDRQMAELMVENWDRDEPDRAGELHVEPVELETSVN
jgi:hypothetical protein